MQAAWKKFNLTISSAESTPFPKPRSAGSPELQSRESVGAAGEPGSPGLVKNLELPSSFFKEVLGFLTWDEASRSGARSSRTSEIFQLQ